MFVSTAFLKMTLLIYREKMAFFTRTKTTVPVLDGESEDILSEDEWEDELEERRTPDGRSSKTSYELRRDHRCTDVRDTACQKTIGQEETSQTECHEQVVECKNPSLNTRLESSDEKTELEKEKTEEDRYEFVVDRVFGVQV